MRKKLGFVLFAALFAVSCSSAKKTEEEDGLEPAIPVESTQLGDSDRGKALGMASVPFDYREFELSAAKKEILKQNAAILKTQKSVMVEIEGHCDHRGGPQINMELGDKRAKEVRKYLISLGVDPMKLTAISYGDTRPLAQGTEESAMKRNRRVNFLIISR